MCLILYMQSQYCCYSDAIIPSPRAENRSRAYQTDKNHWEEHQVSKPSWMKMHHDLHAGILQHESTIDGLMKTGHSQPIQHKHSQTQTSIFDSKVNGYVTNDVILCNSTKIK